MDDLKIYWEHLKTSGQGHKKLEEIVDYLIQNKLLRSELRVIHLADGEKEKVTSIFLVNSVRDYMIKQAMLTRAEGNNEKQTVIYYHLIQNYWKKMKIFYLCYQNKNLTYKDLVS